MYDICDEFIVHNLSFIILSGPYWNRQERLLYSKHVGARLFTLLSNNNQTILIGNRQLAMAA